MFSKQAEVIFQDMYSNYRQIMIDRHSGVNENEIERMFLSDLSVMVYGDLSVDDRERIEKIR